MTSAAAIMAAFALSDHQINEEIYKLLDEQQEKDQEIFINSLKGEPKAIWKRRINRGLTESELTFIRSKLYGENGTKKIKV
jgi:hypothetical protein